MYDAHAIRDFKPSQAFTIVLIALAVMSVLAFPGDAPVWYDTAAMLSRACSAADAGQLAVEGITGSLGHAYGPASIQFYQAIVCLTRSPHAIVTLHSILYLAATIGSLWSLGRTLRLPLAFIAVVLMTPHARLIHRLPWQTQYYPLGCLLLASYARWIVCGSRASAATWGACAAMLPLVHPMSLPLSVAVLLHAGVARWSACRRRLGWVVLGAAIASATSSPYLFRTATDMVQRVQMRLGGYPTDRMQSTGASTGPARWQSAAMVFTGPLLLSGWTEFHHLPAESPWNAPAAVTRAVSMGSFLWVGAGVAVAVMLLRRRTDNPRTSLGLVAMLALVIQPLLFASARSGLHIHYTGGAWAAIVLLGWLGVDLLWHRRLARWIVVIAPATGTVATLMIAAGHIHVLSGSPEGFGPTLSNLNSLANQLGKLPPAIVWTDSPYLAEHPEALGLMFRLRSRVEGDPSRCYLIRRRDARPGDGLLLLERIDTPPDDARFRPVSLF